jgi:hypothetical protein
MPDGDIIADQTGELIGEVHDGVVLNIGVVADNDAVDVPAEHGIVPDTREIAQRDIADHYRALREIDPFAKNRATAKKRFELSGDVGHVSGLNHNKSKRRTKTPGSAGLLEVSIENERLEDRGSAHSGVPAVVTMVGAVNIDRGDTDRSRDNHRG